MLVLSRKVNQTLVIGDNLITITVVKVQGDKVKLGITAPVELNVDREEIWKKKNATRTSRKTKKPPTCP